MQANFTRSVYLLLTLLLALPLVGQLEDPPETLIDGIRADRPTVTRSFFDDEIVLYTGGDYTADDVTWMIDHIREVWRYMKANYGYFGEDPRIYAVVHSNPEYRTATINTRFDAGFGYRNTIDLGGAWDWRDPTADVNIDVITHELAHIVEGGNNNVKESPSFQFWADGPWPEIFQYDAYLNANMDTVRAQRWFDKVINNTNTHRGPNGGEQHHFFRDWFYPLWRDNGGAAFFDRYFKALSTHFRQQPINDVNVPDSIPTSAFRASFGEILYFTNLASGKDNKQLFTDAFGWNEAREQELLDARFFYDTEEIGDTIDYDYVDITDDAPGIVLTSQHPDTLSPAAEQLPNLFDGSYLTKWLVFRPSSWVQFESDNQYVVTGYTMTSGNDAASRDPINWNLQGSDDGENWTTIDERTDEDFIVRFYQRLFTFDNDVPYSHYRFNIDTVESPTIIQVADISLLTTKNAVSVPRGANAASLNFHVFPNPAEDRLFLDQPNQFTRPTIRVFSALGRQLLTQTSSLGAGIDISALPTGSYIIQLEDRGSVGTRKFIKR